MGNPDIFNETTFFREAKESFEAETKIMDSPLNTKDSRWLNKRNSPGLSGAKHLNSTIGSKFNRSR